MHLYGACTYIRSQCKGACTSVNPNFPFLDNEKNQYTSHTSACNSFSNLQLSSKSPCAKLLFHRINLISLCRASFRIVSEGMFLNIQIYASYIGACTYSQITFCIQLCTKPPDHSKYVQLIKIMHICVYKSMHLNAG